MSSQIEIALKKLRDIAVTPEEKDFEELIKIYNPAFSIDKPAFIAIPGNSDDVKRCLKVADDTNVPVTVKCGGHSFAGYSTIDHSGFVISMKRFNGVTRKNDQITVGAGCIWNDVYKVLEGSGYVAVGGCCPTVGIAGYILGGGYGLQSRSHGGLGCDKVISFTMVTAKGDSVVTASENENQDLFWALKGGGGGNFGVLLGVTLKLSESPKRFFWTKMTFVGPKSIKDTLDYVNEKLYMMPKEMNVDMMLQNNLLTVDVVYSERNIEAVIAILDCLKKQRTCSEFSSFLEFITEYGKQHSYVVQEENPVYMKGAVLEKIPPDLTEFFASLEIPTGSNVTFVHMGGDISKISPECTAFVHRSCQYSYYTYGRYTNEEEKNIVYQFSSLVYERVCKSSYAKGSYINYMDRRLENWSLEYYGSNYKRLCEIKQKWNPVQNGGLHFQQEIGSTWNPSL